MKLRNIYISFSTNATIKQQRQQQECFAANTTALPHIPTSLPPLSPLTTTNNEAIHKRLSRLFSNMEERINH